MFMKSIMAGPGLVVSNNYTSEPSISGLMTWDNNSKCVRITEVNSPNSYNNTPQQLIMTMPTIQLAPEVEAVLNWARTKMYEDQKVQALVAKHPGLKDTKEKYEIMLALVQQEEKNANS